MAKVIVIGAGGQVAADLVPILHQRGDDVTLVDRLPPEETQVSEIFARCFRGESDWTQRWRVFDASDVSADRSWVREIRPDVVYQLAAVLSAKCEERPGDCWQANMQLLRNFLEEVHKLTADDYRPKLIWPSSIAAFGPPPGTESSYTATNDHPLLPKTMYGVTKVAGELLGGYYAEKHGVDFRSLRFPGLLNTAEPGGGSSDYANAMYYAAADGTGSSVSFVRPQARIPFMYMADAVRALIQLADAEASRLTTRVYNIRSFAAPSAAEIAASIELELPGFHVTYRPDERERNVDSWPDDFDDAPARRDWDWKPEVADLQTMTRRLLADFRSARWPDLATDAGLRAIL